MADIQEQVSEWSLFGLLGMFLRMVDLDPLSTR